MHRLIPDFILRQYEQQETSGSFSAVCLLVDISGFTPLTNALVHHGIQGAEILADLLAAVFNPLVTIVHQQTGFIANFVGDAFKAIFPLQDDTTYQHALTAACRIRDYISQHNRFDTPFGTFSFAVKLALADGPVEWGIWRYENPTAAQQAVYYFEGEGLAACLATDSIAQAGDLVITDAVYKHLQPLLPKSHRVAGNHWQVGAVLETHYQPARSRPTAAHTPHAAAAAFYPRELLHSRLRGEFRQVVTVFINLQTIPKADLFAPLLFKLLEEYGGYLGRVGRIGSQDQGTTLLLFWGAPHSFENNIARALQFTLALQSATTIPFKVGITHHLAFAGFVGAPEREEYTCYGAYVNQAARQMSAAAWGEIWLDAETAIQAESAFRVVYNGTIPLKGFERPQPIYQLVGQYASTDNVLYAASTMFGREQEFNALLSAIQPLLDGRFGGLVTIRGEAGIGKSRLLNEFFQAEFVTTHTQVFICQTDEILRQSLNPFIYWLRRYFDQSAAASKTENKNRFQNNFDRLVAQTAAALQPELERVHSFLGALLGLRWPNSLYEQVESKLRFDNTLQAIITLLKAASEQRPVILVLEDVHWLDPDSQQLSEMILRQADELPLMLLATTRPAESETTWISLPASIPQTTIELQALPNEVLNELAQMLLSGPVTADLLAIITHRAEGNPFFVEQLLLYLQEQRLLRKQEGVWTIRDHEHMQSTLPRDVRAVLVARLDRLTNEVKQVVQTAAVLGREFSVRVLMHMLREDHLVIEKVETAAQATIWIALAKLRYLFKHILMRDAAYEMQLHAQRRELHQLAAESLEQLYAADLTPYFADLAYHYEQAHNPDKARHYLYQAGQQAQSAYQNNQAYDYFSRALALTPAADLNNRYHLLLGLEAIHDLQGNREQQRSHLNQLEQLAPQLPQEESERALAQVKYRRASYFFRIGDYDQAITMADEAIVLAAQSDEVEIAINSHLVNSQASWGGGYPEAAVNQAAQALQKAQTAGLARLEAYTLRIMGNIATVQGDYDNGYFLFEQALVRSRAVGFRLNEAECLNALGVISFFQGKYTHAAEYHTEGLAMRREMGDRMGEAKVIGNLGDALFRLGQMEHVADYLQRSLTMRQEVNDPPGEAWALDKLGDLALFEEDLTAAAALYQQALHIRTEIHAYRDQEWSMHNVGNSYRLQGEFAQAEQILQEALRISREINDRDGASLTHHQLGRLWHTQGDLARAQSHYQQALEIQRELYNYAGEGMTLSTIALAHHQQRQDEEAAVVGRTALGIARRIGYQTQIATAALLLGRIYLSVGQWAASAEYLQQALTIRQQWPQPLHTAEVLAAQAHLALQQGQLATAVTLTEQILPHLTNPNLTLLHEPTYLYWVSYQVLQATTDGRAAEIVQMGQTFLQNRLSHIKDPHRQHLFINSIPSRKEIMNDEL